jgi:hypothetical protein
MARKPKMNSTALMATFCMEIGNAREPRNIKHNGRICKADQRSVIRHLKQAASYACG